MRMAIAAALLPLAACGRAPGRAGDGDADRAGSVHIATGEDGGRDRISVDIPGFAGQVALPRLDLGRHIDLDGIRLAPGTVVRAIDITGRDAGGAGGGRVRLRFANPRPPAALADYYRRSAAAAGFAPLAAGPGAVAAAKGGKRFALAVAPHGAGSEGTITMSGED